MTLIETAIQILRENSAPKEDLELLVQDEAIGEIIKDHFYYKRFES